VTARAKELEEWNRAEPYATPRDVPLRFDGLYQGPAVGTTRLVMRFYADGLVLVSGGGSAVPPATTMAWLAREGTRPFAHGRFVASGSSIRFETRSMGGNASFEGTVEEGKLSLKRRDAKTGERTELVLEFAAVPPASPG
jgi:hypothetical protein